MKPATRKKIRDDTVKYMKALNTYRKEFDPVIEIYAGLLFQYAIYEKQHEETGYKVTDIYVNKSGAENERKVPILTALEMLRKDILSYSDRLMLNPRSLGEINETETESPLMKLFALEKKKT